MSRIPSPGVIAAGHPQTAAAAAEILQAGGNAFDAVVAAHLAACVAEPVLASLGGGGYLLAATDRQTWIYDFFVQTPKRRRPPESLDFYPIRADFGTASQEFHIGLGAVATPGVVRGLWRIQKQLGRLPMTEVAQPAIRLARDGVIVNAFQAYIFDIVAPIYRSHPETFATYRSPTRPECLLVSWLRPFSGGRIWGGSGCGNRSPTDRRRGRCSCSRSSTTPGPDNRSGS